LASAVSTFAVVNKRLPIGLDALSLASAVSNFAVVNKRLPIGLDALKTDLKE
jgi:hypothetical protein